VEGVWGDRGDSGILVRIKGVSADEQSRVLHTHEACGGGRSEMGGREVVGDLPCLGLWRLAGSGSSVGVIGF
jgi:hypothetical protein